MGLGFGLGLLRWWSLIRAWNLSAIRVSSADNLGIGAVWELSSGVSSSWRCSSEAEEKEYGLRICEEIGERRCWKCSFDLVKAIAEFQPS